MDSSLPRSWFAAPPFYAAAIYASADIQCNPYGAPHGRPANRDKMTAGAGAVDSGFGPLYGGEAGRDSWRG